MIITHIITMIIIITNENNICIYIYIYTHNTHYASSSRSSSASFTTLSDGCLGSNSDEAAKCDKHCELQNSVNQ